MKRRSLLLSTTALTGLTAARGAAPAEPPVLADSVPMVEKLVASPPALLAPSQSSVTIVWAVNALCLGRVTIGEMNADGTEGPALINSQQPTDFGFQTSGETVLKVVVAGLKPNVTYWYATVTEALEPPLKGKVETSEKFRFHLPGADQKELSFVVWNDTHDAAPTLKKLHQQTRERKPDFMLWNGDISNNVDRQAQLTPLYLAPAGGLPFAAETVCYHSRGNHDVRGLRAPLLSNYLAFPGDKPYFSFRLGPLAAIVLDTGEDKPDNHPFFKGMAAFQPLREEQAAWLKEEINKPHLKDAPFRVVFCHIPLRWTNEKQVAESGPNGYDWVSLRSRALWHDSLVAWGTQVVISGHTHAWTYLEPAANFPYAQLIGGGPKAAEGILIHGKATPDKLAITLTDLQDKVVKELAYKPVG